MNEYTKAKYILTDAQQALVGVASIGDMAAVRKYAAQIDDAARVIGDIEAKRTFRAVLRSAHDGVGRRSCPQWARDEAKHAALVLWTLRTSQVMATVVEAKS